MRKQHTYAASGFELLKGSTQEDEARRLHLKYDHVMKFLHPLLRPSEVDKIKKRGTVVCVYDCYGRDVLDWVTIWMFRHNVAGRIHHYLGAKIVGKSVEPVFNLHGAYSCSSSELCRKIPSSIMNKLTHLSPIIQRL
ncbi:hypothetical protein POM88_046372 [Heracleum sosnowskyi]|uniref:Uncharacterized protein n=1 Tax=Heracleum sosnowskyi TaxID=360622 RepID=A0AAD8H8E0_9APIA|nr:hypothetical protein POM88_046372 [Heracleum sosnowskyi]